MLTPWLSSVLTGIDGRVDAGCPQVVALAADLTIVESQASRELVLGVDFGTSTSSAAVYDDGEIELAVDGRDPAIPSVVHVPRSGPMLAGRDALRAAQSDPLGLVTNVKKLLGVQGRSLRVRGVEVAPVQVVGALLARVRMLAEARCQGVAHRAVFTVPAERSETYAADLTMAASLAGLEAVGLVSEPIAGVMAYGIPYGGDRRIAVVDFGGQTFTATLVEQRGMRFTPRGLASEPIGGDDFDLALAEAVDTEHARCWTLRDDAVRWSRLVWKCEAVKRHLSTALQSRLHMPDAWPGGEDLDITVERAWVEPRFQLLAHRAGGVMQDLLTRTGWTARSVDRVVLIGGTTLIPAVLELMSEVLERMLVATPQATLAVARGAAMLATRHAAAARPMVEVA